MSENDPVGISPSRCFFPCLLNFIDLSPLQLQLSRLPLRFAPLPPGGGPSPFGRLGPSSFLDAEVLLEKALTRAPDFFQGWMDLGQARQEQDRTDDALEAYGHAMRLQPDKAQA